jgi:hypothetical protein
LKNQIQLNDQLNLIDIKNVSNLPQVTAGVREWDVGKVTVGGETPAGPGREGVKDTTEKGIKKEEWRSGKENRTGAATGPAQHQESQPTTDTKRRAHTPDHKEFPRKFSYITTLQP